MISNRDILNCLPLLASALGDRYGVKVLIGGFEAYTDGRSIHIPTLPTDCGKTAIALAKGYVDHEAAHIRHTDFSALGSVNLDAATRHLFNSIENWRVEKRLSERYPGCRNNLDWLIEHLLMENPAKAGDENPAFAVLGYVLLSVRSWNVSEVAIAAQEFRQVVDKAYPGLTGNLDWILDRVKAHCPDTQAAILYAREMAEAIRQYQKTSQSLAKADESVEGSRPEQNDDESQGFDGESGDSDCEADEPADANPNQAESRESKRNPKGGKSKEQDAGQPSSDAEADCPRSEADLNEAGSIQANAEALASLSNLFDQSPDELPKSFGEILAEKLAENACGTPEAGFSVAKCERRQSGPLPDDERSLALRSSNALRQRLSGLLQAAELKRMAKGRRGKLNTTSLYRLSVGNPRVFCRESVRQGQNSAVHLLLDASYSMKGEAIRLARQACFAATNALACIKGVNPAVTVFPGRDYGGVYPIMAHSQKLEDNFGVDAYGGTPLTPALWWVAQALYPLSEQRKIILLITDGMPNHIESAMEAIKIISRLGVEIYGIGIKSNFIQRLLPDYSRVIHNLAELAPCLFELLQESLLRGGWDGSH